MVLVAGLLGAFTAPALAAEYRTIPSGAARYQWNNANGYCGECSLQMAGIDMGFWVSQDQARKLAGGEALLGEGENYDTLLGKLHLVYADYVDTGTGSAGRQSFLQWIRDGQVAGDPVVFCVKYQGGGDPYYDHIIIAHAVSGGATGYNGTDVLRYSDHETGVEMSQTFDEWRDGWSKPGSVDYYLPENEQYGTRITGMEGDGETLPVSLTVASRSEPNVTLGQAPVTMSATVDMAGLAPGATYTLLRWDATASTIGSVPFSGLRQAATAADVESSFTAAGATATKAVTFTSGGITIFRLMAGTIGSVAPTVTGFAPASGPVGTVVTVDGSGLTGATAVTVNGAPATSFTVRSATQLTFTVPAAASSGKVRVTTPGGTAASAASFSVTPTPKITVTAPASAVSWPCGSMQTVSWTIDSVVAVGEFRVWLVSPTGQWYVGRQVLPVAGRTAYAAAFAVGVPAGTGYRAYVYWRPAVGSGAWAATARSASIAATPGTPTIAVTAPTAASSWKSGSSQSVAWTLSGAVSGGEFRVWLVRSSTQWYLGRQVLPVAGQTAYAAPVTVSVPAGPGYQAYVYWRPVAGSGAWQATARSAVFIVTP